MVCLSPLDWARGDLRLSKGRPTNLWSPGLAASSASVNHVDVTSTPVAVATKVGHYRWVICALLFFAATINYIDRQVIGILKPTLVKEFGWQDERIYAAIVFSFQLAYAIGLLLAGRVMDRIGTRLGFAIAVVLWSIAAVGHAVADWFP